MRFTQHNYRRAEMWFHKEAVRVVCTNLHIFFNVHICVILECKVSPDKVSHKIKVENKTYFPFDARSSA